MSTFIDNKIAGIVSYGASSSQSEELMDKSIADIDDNLANASFGEYSVDTRISKYKPLSKMSPFLGAKIQRLTDVTTNASLHAPPATSSVLAGPSVAKATKSNLKAQMSCWHF